MARVEGFDPASPGQQPGDANNSPVPVRVRGDSGTGMFDTLPQDSGVPLDTPAAVEEDGLPGVDFGPAEAGRYLPRSFAGTLDLLNVCSGTVTTGGDGAARIALPEHFEALHGDFRYQLTVVGHFAQAVVAEEIDDNAFTIRTDSPQVKVSWQVTGVRRAAGIPHGTGPLSAPVAGPVPQPLPARAGNRLQPMVQDDPVDDEELRLLLAGIQGRAEASAAAARARLKEQWGKVQEGLHEQLPDPGQGRPTEG